MTDGTGVPGPGQRGRWQRFGAPVLAAASVIGLVLGALVGWIAFSPHDPGSDSVEAGFARDMSEHHLQAVEMSLLVLGRSESGNVDTLAYDIASTQANQIGQMEGWLRTWGLPTARSQGRMAWMEEHDAHGSHSSGGTSSGSGGASSSDPVMPGMATTAEMQQLREADGEDAEVLFLQLMITHHVAGVEMAQAAVDLADEPEVLRIARAMVNAQESEIRLMVDLLHERDAAPREDLADLLGGAATDEGGDGDGATSTADPGSEDPGSDDSGSEDSDEDSEHDH